MRDDEARSPRACAVGVSGMRSCGHSADGQLGFAFEELPDALYLVVELAALRGGELVERLHRDVELPARAALVPDPGDYSMDEQHRKVPGLATGEGAFGGPAGKEYLAWLAAGRISVE